VEDIPVNELSKVETHALQRLGISVLQSMEIPVSQGLLRGEEAWKSGEVIWVATCHRLRLLICVHITVDVVVFVSLFLLSVWVIFVNKLGCFC